MAEAEKKDTAASAESAKSDTAAPKAASTSSRSKKTTTPRTGTTHARKKATNEPASANAVNTPALQAPTSPAAVSPSGETVESVHNTEKFVVRKRLDTPVIEVSPVPWEGPAPLTVSYADWKHFQKAVAAAKVDVD